MCGLLVPEVCEWLSSVADVATIVGAILALVGFRAAYSVWPSVVSFYRNHVQAESASVAHRGSMSAPVVNTQGAGTVHVNINSSQTMTTSEVETEAK